MSKFFVRNTNATATSDSPDETEALGYDLGKIVTTGDLIILEGPLAAGKTAFTRGIVAGSGFTDRVTSPTYALMQEYTKKDKSGSQFPSKVKKITHIDAYRLNNGDELEILEIEQALSEGAVVIEWGKKFAAELNEHYLLIDFHLNQTDSAKRKLQWEWI